jgi:hypothetical protein
MDRFWIFLEAVAGILAEQTSAESLKRDLSQMEAKKRDRMNKCLEIVSEKLPQLLHDR